MNRLSEVEHIKVPFNQEPIKVIHYETQGIPLMQKVELKVTNLYTKLLEKMCHGKWM